MTTARRTQPNVLEFDVVLAAVVVVVGWDVVVVGCVRVVVVVGATVVVVTGAVVVVSWAAAVPDMTPSRTGVAPMARTNAIMRRETFECIHPAYGQWQALSGDHGRSRPDFSG